MKLNQSILWICLLGIFIGLTGMVMAEWEHDDITSKMVIGNEQVRSFSQCDACHTRAKQGSFREHEIHIPGYGRWDD
jgi:hypothetical protein